MRRIFFIASMLLIFVMVFTMLSAQQATGVTAEAVGQANLRAWYDVNSDLVGEITAGTSYPVIGQSELYPWVLLADPVTVQPIGWVFDSLVVIQGNRNAVPYTTQTVTDAPQPPTPSPSPSTNTVNSSPIQATPTQTTAPQNTPTPTFQVTGIIQGEVNIRYGPGVEYDRIGVAQAGERYEVLSWHTQFPWLKIRFPQAPNGEGWIALDLLDVEGDVFTLPSTSQTIFVLPTLTPTPSVIQTSSLPQQNPVELSPGFEQLAEQIWNIVLFSGFDPQTSRFGALFLMDLQTGEAITFGNEYAFSGTSINKVPILARLYADLEAPPDSILAANIANTMICSENTATNRLLAEIGNGDEFFGAEEVTRFMRQLGLENTFLTAPYTIDPNNPPVPLRPISLPQTEADQIKSEPDPSNQMTVDEMGWMLASMYQCGYESSGALIENFSNTYSPRECRQMLHVMSSNTVDALLKAGVPENTRVAHKHGWIPDTHGNAAVFFTPGGNYVLVMMLHQPEWLFYEESLPVIAEVSRTVYNYYNPTAPQETVRDGFIPEPADCNFAGSPLIQDLMRTSWDQ